MKADVIRDYIRTMAFNIYACRGRIPANYTNEIDSFVDRFYTKVKSSTIGDIKAFGEMVCNGDIRIEFLNVTNLLGAWREYCIKRNDATTDARKKAEERQDYKPVDDDTRAYGAMIMDKIHAKMKYMSDAYDRYKAEWEKTHGKRYNAKEDNIVNGINLSYNAWKDLEIERFEKIWEETHGSNKA